MFTAALGDADTSGYRNTLDARNEAIGNGLNGWDRAILTIHDSAVAAMNGQGAVGVSNDTTDTLYAQSDRDMQSAKRLGDEADADYAQLHARLERAVDALKTELDRLGASTPYASGANAPDVSTFDGDIWKVQHADLGSHMGTVTFIKDDGTTQTCSIPYSRTSAVAGSLRASDLEDDMYVRLIAEPSDSDCRVWLMTRK